jgi:ribosomal protein S27AE
MSRKKRKREDDDERDDRPPICPNCGVTQGIVLTDGDDTKFVCLECGFSDDESSGD